MSNHRSGVAAHRQSPSSSRTIRSPHQVLPSSHSPRTDAASPAPHRTQYTQSPRSSLPNYGQTSPASPRHPYSAGSNSGDDASTVVTLGRKGGDAGVLSLSDALKRIAFHRALGEFDAVETLHHTLASREGTGGSMDGGGGDLHRNPSASMVSHFEVDLYRDAEHTEAMHVDPRADPRPQSGATQPRITTQLLSRRSSGPSRFDAWIAHAFDAHCVLRAELDDVGPGTYFASVSVCRAPSEDQATVSLAVKLGVDTRCGGCIPGLLSRGGGGKGVGGEGAAGGEEFAPYWTHRRVFVQPPAVSESPASLPAWQQLVLGVVSVPEGCTAGIEAQIWGGGGKHWWCTDGVLVDTLVLAPMGAGVPTATAASPRRTAIPFSDEGDLTTTVRLGSSGLVALPMAIETNPATTPTRRGWERTRRDAGGGFHNKPTVTGAGTVAVEGAGSAHDDGDDDDDDDGDENSSTTSHQLQTLEGGGWEVSVLGLRREIVDLRATVARLRSDKERLHTKLNQAFASAVNRGAAPPPPPQTPASSSFGAVTALAASTMGSPTALASTPPGHGGSATISMEEFEAANDESRRMRALNERLEREVERLHAQIEAQDSAMDEAQAEGRRHRQEVEEAYLREHDAQDEVRMLRKKLETLQAHHEREVSRAQTLEEGLQKQLDELQRVQENYERAGASAMSSAKNRHANEVEELMAKLEDRDASAQSLHVRLEAVQQERDVAKAELTAAQRDLRSSERTVESLEEEVALLRKQAVHGGVGSLGNGTPALASQSPPSPSHRDRGSADVYQGSAMEAVVSLVQSACVELGYDSLLFDIAGRGARMMGACQCRVYKVDVGVGLLYAWGGDHEDVRYPGPQHGPRAPKRADEASGGVVGFTAACCSTVCIDVDSNTDEHGLSESEAQWGSEDSPMATRGLLSVPVGVQRGGKPRCVAVMQWLSSTMVFGDFHRDLASHLAEVVSLVYNSGDGEGLETIEEGDEEDEDLEDIDEDEVTDVKVLQSALARAKLKLQKLADESEGLQVALRQRGGPGRGGGGGGTGAGGGGNGGGGGGDSASKASGSAGGGAAMRRKKGAALVMAGSVTVQSLAAQTDGTSIASKLPHHDKEDYIREMIHDVLRTNPISCKFSSCSSWEYSTIVDAFESVAVSRGEVVIQQGDEGDYFYVIEKGTFEAVVNGRVVALMRPGKGFGELALIQDSPRAATVRLGDSGKSKGGGKLWRLQRDHCDMVTLLRRERSERCVKYLSSIKISANERASITGAAASSQDSTLGELLDDGMLGRLVDQLEEEEYEKGTCLMRQGDSGDELFIIEDGTVEIYVATPEQQRTLNMGTKVNEIGPGTCFGEKALLGAAYRNASCVVSSKKLRAYRLDRASFEHALGSIAALLQAQSSSHDADGTPTGAGYSEVEWAPGDLEDLRMLGCGTFGRVKLVRHGTSGTHYALKCQSKHFIVQKKMQQRVINEMNIMRRVRGGPFLLTLAGCAQDSLFLYFLLDFLPGGEMFTHLARLQRFDEATTKFYTAQLVLAFGHLHAHNIIYRDLKPENLVLDMKGYLQVIDFGMAKMVKGKTWTFCGTPDYLAPEIIQNKGHDKAVDYWALGVIVYEMLHGLPPFMANQVMQTYKKICIGDVDYDDTLCSKNLKALISGLLTVDVGKRFGMSRDGIVEIKRHKWFVGFDYIQLEARNLQAPLDLELEGPTDTRYFDDPDLSGMQDPEDCDWAPSLQFDGGGERSVDDTAAAAATVEGGVVKTKTGTEEEEE